KVDGQITIVEQTIDPSEGVVPAGMSMPKSVQRAEIQERVE
ncbi:hypothetical protein A2U01_0054970, partial [Trifolium medium]|nr:hypothetical protein [Trifolium medium]